MQPFPGRYNTDGPWLKGAPHVHTTRSDGGMDYRETAETYAEAGYDFMFVTDHEHPGDIEEMAGLPLLALNGVEIGGQDGTGASFHAVGLDFGGMLPHEGTFNDKVACLKRAGALVVLAHPCWMGNTVADALRHGFDGVEVYNHICNYLNGKSLATYHYDRMLEADPGALAFSVDDAHLQPGQPYDGGWIMVAAAAASKEAVMEAIRAGNFYSSQGPVIESIAADERGIHVHTGPAAYIRITDNSCWGSRVYEGGEPVTEAEFEIDRECAYVRLEVEDEYGRLAWTNAVLRTGKVNC